MAAFLFGYRREEAVKNGSRSHFEQTTAYLRSYSLHGLYHVRSLLKNVILYPD